MAGRVAGLVLISKEEGLPTSNLVEALGASKGAISTATRMMEQFQMLERYHVRGSREAHFRIPPGMWGEAVRNKMAIMGRMRTIAERGLEAVGDAPVPRARLQEMRDIYEFFERSLPELYDRFERERGIT